MSISSRIAQVRGNKSLSQFARELSEVNKNINFEHSNIRKYEAGDILPSTNFYIAVLKRYNVNINWLLTGEGDKKIK